jgi:hypothetical protein
MKEFILSEGKVVDWKPRATPCPPVNPHETTGQCTFLSNHLKTRSRQSQLADGQSVRPDVEPFRGLIIPSFSVPWRLHTVCQSWGARLEGRTPQEGLNAKKEWLTNSLAQLTSILRRTASRSKRRDSRLHFGLNLRTRNSILIGVIPAVQRRYTTCLLLRTGALLGCYAASSGIFLQTFRDNLSVSSPKVKNRFLTIEDGTDKLSRNVGKE